MSVATDVPTRPMKTFRRVWLGQVTALAATAVTDFVLSVWVLETTGSITQYSLISVFIVLSSIVASPFIGVLADRRSRRGLLLTSNLTAATVAASVAALDAAGWLQVWHVYIAAAVVSVCTATHFIVCQTLVGTMLPPEQQGKAIGLLMMVPGFQIAAPVVGAALYAGVGIKGVALLEVVFALVAAANLLTVRLPEAEPDPAETPASMLAEMRFGLAYLRARPLLLVYTALIVTVVPFVMGLAGLLVRPLILSFGSLGDLSLLTFLGGLGFLAGSLLITLTGGPERKVVGIWGGLLVGGFLLAAHALRPSVTLLAVVAPLFLFLVPVITACSQTLVIRKLEPFVIGRIMGVTRTVSQIATGLAYLAAGPLVERVLNPAVAPGGALDGLLEPIIGTGPGRGVAAVYLACGALFVALGLYGWLNPRLRNIETLLPDPSRPQHVAEER